MPHLHRLAGLMIACAVVAVLLLPDHVFRGDAGAPRHRAQAAAARRIPARSAQGAAGSCGGAGCAGGGGGTAGLAAVGLPAAAVRVGANELGEVPVIMYHRILAKPKSTLDRTPQDLRTELVRLATDGYVPITAADFVAGRINIPAGTHPVVLTFDDGAPGQFAFDPQGNPTQDSATGVILDVSRQYPSFRPVATFFVNADPFGLGPRAGEAVRWLVQHGFEVANHTTHHLDLATLGKEGMQREIGTDEKMITDLGAPAPTTFAYPYGALRKAKLGWAKQGTAGGASWNFAGMFLAGWKPSASPFEKDFDPTLIDRIRSDGKIKEAGCDQFCSTAWLDWLDKNPDKRYTSDGDARVISYPAAKADSLAVGLRALGRGY